MAAGLGVLVPLACAAAAPAATITVTNPGFESYNLSPLADGAFYKGSAGLSVTGWTADSGSGDDEGLLNPNSTQTAGGAAPEGSVVLWLRSGFGVKQTLSATAAAGEIYTLTVAVESRLDAVSSGYKIQLLAGATVLKTIEDDTAWAVGTSHDVTLTYNSTGMSAGLVGAPLAIRIASSPILSGHDKQTLFDDVRLSGVSASPVPEPWSAAVIAAGALGVVIRRR
jgi:hypothetical protein